MPYKTKFRKIELPPSEQGVDVYQRAWDAISGDANSRRSLGAAVYAQFVNKPRIYYKDGNPDRQGVPVNMSVAVADFPAKVIREIQPDADLSKCEITARYFREGILKAATDAGDAETAKYVFGVLGRRIPKSLKVKTDDL